MPTISRSMTDISVGRASTSTPCCSSRGMSAGSSKGGRITLNESSLPAAPPLLKLPVMVSCLTVIFSMLPAATASLKAV